MSLIGRFVMASPYWLWRLFPGWLRDIGWLHGPKR